MMLFCFPGRLTVFPCKCLALCPVPVLTARGHTVTDATLPRTGVSESDARRGEWQPTGHPAPSFLLAPQQGPR